MFKKLKQKIEEGGDGGIEKATFSPRKLPGSVIRSSSRNEDASTSASTPQASQTLPTQEEQPTDTRDEDQGVTIETVALSIKSQQQVKNSCGSNSAQLINGSSSQ